MNLRAERPPPTNRAPAPSANSEAALVPPVFGSAFFFSAFGALVGAAFGAGAGAAFAGAGVGAGAAFGGGAGAGAAFGGGGGGGAALGGSGSHGALATTPPALASIIPSLHSASAFAPPALASLALASATTAGSSWARAGEAASRATASIAASIISFLKLTYLLLLESSFPLGGGPSEKEGSASMKSFRSVVSPTISRRPSRPG